MSFVSTPGAASNLDTSSNQTFEIRASKWAVFLQKGRGSSNGSLPIDRATAMWLAPVRAIVAPRVYFYILRTAVIAFSALPGAVFQDHLRVNLLKVVEKTPNIRLQSTYARLVSRCNGNLHTALRCRPATNLRQSVGRAELDANTPPGGSKDVHRIRRLFALQASQRNNPR